MAKVHDGAELCFPHLFNISCVKPMTSWTDIVFLQVLLSSVSVLIVALNLLVIISISHFRHLHKPTNLLLLSLSVSDILVGLVFFPGEILRKTSCWFLGDLMCSLYAHVSLVSVSASIGNMVLISVDRHVAICDPLHYSTRVTVRRVKVSIFLCWFCSNLYNSLFVKTDQFQKDKYSSCSGECGFNNEFSLGVIDVVVTFIVPVSVIIVLYMRVFVVAVSQARAMRSHVTAVTVQHPVTLTSRRSEMKAARTLGVLVAVFIMCFCPFYCIFLAGVDMLKTPFGTFVICFYCCNSGINPLIYALFYPWFRRAIKLIVTLQILQPDSGDAKI